MDLIKYKRQIIEIKPLYCIIDQWLVFKITENFDHSVREDNTVVKWTKDKVVHIRGIINGH